VSVGLGHWSLKQGSSSAHSDYKITHVQDYSICKEIFLMNKIFDFVDRQKCERIIQKTWEDFRLQLAHKDFLYNDIDKACESTFLHVFDDLFQHGNRFFEKKASDVLTMNTGIVRAARIPPDAKEPDYDRFVPKAEFITKDNRFSPPGVEWLYLAFSQAPPTSDLCIEEICALKECRAKAGERFALCAFEPDSKFQSTTLIDLTIAKESQYEEINDELNQCGREVVRREIAKGYINALVKNVIPTPHIDEIVPALEKWAIFTYAKLLADQIFLPITTEDRALTYAPFQCMAQYFLSKGYSGIVYSSTVFPEGKNVVLFDKEAAHPFGIIKSVTIPVDF